MTYARIAMSALAAVWILATSAATAQRYPDKPVRMLLPYTAGGSYDVIARQSGQKLTQMWGQQVVVDNRPGAAGRIGMEMGVKAVPDGYTIVMLGNNQTIVPSVYKEVPYDLVRDFAPVTMLATLGNILVVHPTVPAASVADLINLAKAKPGTINFGSGGTGGITHLAGELFKSMAAVNIVHVPYKGGALAMNDLVGGQVQMMLLNMLNSIPHIKSGRLKALAVTTSKRSRFVPDLPTLDESGLKGYDIVEWYAIAVPAKTPKSVIMKLNADFNASMTDPEIKEKLDRQAVEVVAGTPEELGAFLKADLQRYARIVKDAGIKPE